MKEDSDPSTATPSSKPRRKLGNLLFFGALVIIGAALGYMEKMPEFLYWPMRVLFVAAVAWLAYAGFRAARAVKFEPRKAVFSLILIAILYGGLYLVCHAFIIVMSARDQRLTNVNTSALSKNARRGVRTLLAGESYSIFDRDIGWVPRPDFQWKMHSINALGLRGPRLYPETPSDPDKRILCVGDSFTFGYEVEDDQTYPHHAEQLVPGTEWINLGNCGSGLTQSLLQYRKNGRRFGGNYVVIGFMTNNNKRTVNCFRPFISPDDPGTPLTKPFAKIDNAEFLIEPNPYQEVDDYRKLLDNERDELGRLHQLDYLTWSRQRGSKNPIVRTAGYVWERRRMGVNLNILLNRPADDSHRKFRRSVDPYGSALWHPDSIGFQTITRVFDTYYKEVIADGRIPLIVVLPSAGDVERRGLGRPPKHTALLTHLDNMGYRYFDFLDSLEKIHKGKLSREAIFGRTHFNGETNKLLAKEIANALGLL